MKIINRPALPILAFGLLTGVVGHVDSQAVDPVQALAAIQEKVLSKGPNGEEPSPATSVSLTTDDAFKKSDHRRLSRDQNSRRTRYQGTRLLRRCEQGRFINAGGEPEFERHLGSVGPTGGRVMSAAQIVGKRDLVITTIDLGLNVAVDMAQNG